MEIKPLSKTEYAGREYRFEYETGGYYDVQREGLSFTLTKKAYDAPKQKYFSDSLFSDWPEAPQAFGAFEGKNCRGSSKAALNHGTTVTV